MEKSLIHSSDRDSSNSSIHHPPTKSRRGRKRVTDPVLANELKRHRRSRANDRERTRMRLLNEALEHLRTLLPIDSLNESSSSVPMIDDKLTKIETLRTASAYIRLLTNLLDESPTSTSHIYQSYELSQHPSDIYSTHPYLHYSNTYSYYHPYC